LDLQNYRRDGDFFMRTYAKPEVIQLGQAGDLTRNQNETNSDTGEFRNSANPEPGDPGAS
jgi:hypothetical protein